MVMFTDKGTHSITIELLNENGREAENPSIMKLKKIR